MPGVIIPSRSESRVGHSLGSLEAFQAVTGSLRSPSVLKVGVETKWESVPKGHGLEGLSDVRCWRCYGRCPCIRDRPLTRRPCGGEPFPPGPRRMLCLYTTVQEVWRAFVWPGLSSVEADEAQPDVGRGLQRWARSRNSLRSLRPWSPRLLGDSRYAMTREGGELSAAENRLQECSSTQPTLLGLKMWRAVMDPEIGDALFGVGMWIWAAMAGARTVFIDRGYSEKLHSAPDFVVRSFGEAVAAVLGFARSNRSSSDRPPGEPIS